MDGQRSILGFSYVFASQNISTIIRYHDQPYFINLTTGATLTTQTSYTPVTELSEGVHTLYVQEQNVAGLWSASGKKAITVDITPPAAPVVSGTSPTTDTTPTWTWVSGGGGGNGRFRCKLDSGKFSAASTLTGYTPVSPLTEDPHTLYVQFRRSWQPVAGRVQRIRLARARRTVI